MSFPAGVTLRTLNFGPAFDLAKGDGLTMSVSVRPSRSLVWLATGSPGIGLVAPFPADSGLEHSIAIPVTDEAGWGDGNGNVIDVSGNAQSHLYEITVSYLRDSQVILKSPSKWIALPTGDGSPIDLDNMIPVSGTGGVSISIPDSWTGQIIDLQERVDEIEANGGGGGGGGAVSSVAGRIGAVTLTKSDVGLANAENTSDANKPVSTAQATALGLKAPLASPAFTGTPTGITKAHVGLGNVSNTADADKAISTAQAAVNAAQAATNQIKADLVDGVVPSSQIPALALTTVVPVATQAAMLALTATQVQPGDVAVIANGGGGWMLRATPISDIGNWVRIDSPAAAGGVQTVNGQSGTVVLGKSDVGLGNVANTADADKPVSSAQQTALDAKAPTANPTFTGTVSGISKAMVALGNVTNTADADKPVSTAQQAALDAKVPGTRTVNGKALSSNVTFTQDDVADGVTNKAFTAANQTKLSNAIISDGTIVKNITIGAAAYAALVSAGTVVATTDYKVVGA